MATDPLDALRLTLMQDVLPVGLAAADRIRRGGPQELLAAFDGSSADPLGRLRQEGEPVASQLRDNLDRLQPGLGNPVMKVEVRDIPSPEPDAAADNQAADNQAAENQADDDRAELQQTLARISGRLERLDTLLAASQTP
jgi:hypothetical protein